MYSVSIPYRFNERTKYNSEQSRVSRFQFLIGSMKGCYARTTNRGLNSFQFLIGSMKVFYLAGTGLLIKVSIPYRFNESAAPIVNTFVPGVFQFLIGSMKADKSKIFNWCSAFQFLIGSMKGSNL